MVAAAALTFTAGCGEAGGDGDEDVSVDASASVPDAPFASSDAMPGPYSRHARNILKGEAYRAAFEHSTGAVVLQDGVTWPAASLPGAELAFTLEGNGFSIAATAPDLKPFTLKFDRP